MKDKQLTFLLVLLFGIGVFALALMGYTNRLDTAIFDKLLSRIKPVAIPKPGYREEIKLTSSAFTNEGAIPVKYTCEGANVSPPLEISNIPEGTKSIVLTVTDPDAPYQTWTHWVIFNIDPRQRKIGENSVPWNSLLGTNDFGTGDYRGPCPPVGKHRYFFNLYALDTIVELEPGIKREELEKKIEGHILDTGTLIGTFEKL